MISSIADRSDYGRDLANFLINHLPQGPDAFGKDLPRILARLPDDVSSTRVKNGFTDRRIIGMGHSFGGDGT